MESHSIWPFVTGWFHLAQRPPGPSWGSRCQNVLPFQGWMMFQGRGGPHLARPFIHRWTLCLLAHFGCCQSCCCEHTKYLFANVSLRLCSQFLWGGTRSRIAASYGNSSFTPLRTHYAVFHGNCIILQSPPPPQVP